jgi:hypothetical protein
METLSLGEKLNVSVLFRCTYQRFAFSLTYLFQKDDWTLPGSLNIRKVSFPPTPFIVVYLNIPPPPPHTLSVSSSCLKGLKFESLKNTRGYLLKLYFVMYNSLSIFTQPIVQ